MIGLLTRQKLKAARNLLDWKQSDLAKLAGVPTSSISNFEAGSRPSLAEKTQLAILRTFAVHGVEITDTHIGFVKSEVRTFTGEDANKILLMDVYETLKDSGGEVLIAGLLEADPEDPKFNYVREHIAKLQEIDVSERILTGEGNLNFIAPKDWYRLLPGDSLSSHPFQVYGNKIAMIDWGPPQQIVIIEHERFAKTFQILFDIAWKIAEPIS